MGIWKTRIYGLRENINPLPLPCLCGKTVFTLDLGTGVTSSNLVGGTSKSSSGLGGLGGMGMGMAQ